MPFCIFKDSSWILLKNFFLRFNMLSNYFCSSLKAEEEEILIQSVADQIQVLTKDLKTLEKAVYQKSDINNIFIQ